MKTTAFALLLVLSSLLPAQAALSTRYPYWCQPVVEAWQSRGYKFYRYDPKTDEVIFRKINDPSTLVYIGCVV
jgi:hypothetical protein